MADRTVYGKTHSENGWRMVDTGSCVWVRVPGSNVTLQIREGQPAKILGAFAADYNAYLEPLRDGDSACWTATNQVSTSNHLSGTGMDLNWNGPDGKTFRLGIPKERAYPGEKSRVLDELLEFYEGMIFCGGYWSIQDWMHLQMGGKTYGSQHVDKVNDFINRKIRSDGFSTFKRGSVPHAPTSPVQVLSQATGLSHQAASDVADLVAEGLHLADAETVKRIAMWLAQVGHESDSFRATEEYQNGDETQDRWKYKGRTWIQITWLSNYKQFSRWAFDKGLIGDPEFFVNNPKKLAEKRWAAIGPAWYWTVARANINTLSDQGNLREVTRLINGGYNGMPDREARYNRALALGDKLLLLLRTDYQGDDDLSEQAERNIERILQEVMQRHPSRSALRRLDEGAVDTWAGMDLNTDGNVHVALIKALAEIGNPEALDLLMEIATADPVEHPDRMGDAELAVQILNHVERVSPDVLRDYLNGR